MRAEEMFRTLGYKTKDGETYERTIRKKGKIETRLFHIDGQEVFFYEQIEDGCIDSFKQDMTFTRREIEAIHKALIENETSFDLDEAVARATLGNKKFKEHTK